MDLELSLSNAKVLILGGSGFIGSNLTDAFLKFNSMLTVVSAEASQIANTNQNLTQIKHNFENGPCDEIKENNYDFVINCTGYIDHSDYFVNGPSIIQNQLFTLFNIIDSLQNKKFKKFIQIGSSDEYGNNTAPQIEDQRELPSTPYGFAKTASTHFIQMLARNIDFPGIVLRPFLVYGPGQKMNRFIPYAIDSCLKKNNFHITDGKQIKDFLYIDDFIEAVFCSIFSSNAINGRIFNVASGNPVSIREVVDIIQRICNGGNPIFGSKPIPKKENQNLYAELNYVKSSLNWEPKIRIEEGLLRVVNYIKKYNVKT